jgi:hypothetical protein
MYEEQERKRYADTDNPESDFSSSPGLAFGKPGIPVGNRFIKKFRPVF